MNWRRPFFAAVSVALLAGCPSKNQHSKDVRDTGYDGRKAPVASRDAGARSISMSAGFSKAHTSFGEHTATALKIAADDVQVSPIDEAGAKQVKQRVGGIHAMFGSSMSQPDKQVRGWATDNGVVITPSQNLGPLFKEAGLWTKSPALTATEAAELLVWAMGMNHRVFVKPRWQMAAPTLELGPDGNGKLTFFSAYREPGPGGAGGGPEQHFECAVTMRADNTATLTKTKLPPR